MTMGTALGDSIQVTIISQTYQVDDYIYKTILHLVIRPRNSLPVFQNQAHIRGLHLNLICYTYATLLPCSRNYTGYNFCYNTST